jgi:hypothetical protein
MGKFIPRELISTIHGGLISFTVIYQLTTADNQITGGYFWQGSSLKRESIESEIREDFSEEMVFGLLVTMS